MNFSLPCWFVVLAICANYSQALSRGQLIHELLNKEQVANGNGTRPCPCSKPDYCQPIETNPTKEVFIFSVTNKNWKKYDWNKVTTVVLFGYVDDELTCYAHSQNARVVFGADFPLKNLTSATDRQNWISQKLAYAQYNFYDGINVDFEDNIPADQPEAREGLTLLIKGVATAFRAAYKNPQVSVDVAWSPDCIDSRCYDYATIANIADISFIMSYDERSQIFNECIAWANSAANTTRAGIERYLTFGVPAHKFVLGLPWYGYVYDCLSYSKVTKKCHIKEVPFRGVACSDAAGSQLNYRDIVNLLPLSFTGRLWDPLGLSPYFTYMDQGRYRQIWYDDVESLNLKNKLADRMGLGGYGMWNADAVDYSDTPEGKRQREEMWNTFPDKI